MYHAVWCEDSIIEGGLDSCIDNGYFGKFEKKDKSSVSGPSRDATNQGINWQVLPMAGDKKVDKDSVSELEIRSGTRVPAIV